jgi:hypothetical protein
MLATNQDEQWRQVRHRREHFKEAARDIDLGSTAGTVPLLNRLWSSLPNEEQVYFDNLESMRIGFSGTFAQLDEYLATR